jgi:hypothetical protein
LLTGANTLEPHTYKRVDKRGTFHTLWSKGPPTEIESEGVALGLSSH